MNKRESGDTQGKAPAEPGTEDLQARIRDEVKAILAPEITAVKTEIISGLGQLTQQIDGRIEQAVDARLKALRDEITTVITQMRPGQPQPAPSAAAQPPGNGHQPANRASILESLPALMPLLKEFMQPPQVNPVAQLTAQVGQLADLIAAVDKIRGGAVQAGSSMTPKTALDWAKWGHQLAKSGAPAPTFPAVSHEEPPAGQV